MRREMEEHNDLVFLPVTEGYRMNSRKAFDSRCVYDLLWFLPNLLGTTFSGITLQISGC